MKVLPGMTFLIWGGFLLGSWLGPGVFKQDAIQFFLTVLFSVLLPICFWQLAQQKGKKYFSLLFVGIFIINIFLLGTIIRSNFILHQQLSAKLDQGIDLELAEYVVNGNTSSKRRIAARFIYHHYGVALPFKDAADSYSLYQPSSADKKKFQENFFATNELKLQRSGLAASLFTALALLLIHVGLFLGLLIFLILYDNKKE